MMSLSVCSADGNIIVSTCCVLGEEKQRQRPVVDYLTYPCSVLDMLTTTKKWQDKNCIVELYIGKVYL